MPEPVPVCINVALDVPMRQTFSYLIDAPEPAIGVRLRVPFGRRKMVGVMVGKQDVPPEGIKLRRVEAVLDSEPLFSPSLIRLLDWTARYYHHPPGEVWRAAMPAILRKGKALDFGLIENSYRLRAVPEGWPELTRRATIQQKIIKALLEHPDGISSPELLKIVPNARTAIRALQHKGWLERFERLPKPAFEASAAAVETLTTDQLSVLAELLQATPDFRCSVLEGVTGSGKTEVYFGLIDHCIEQRRQSLIMVPEIALTDQLLSRFKKRFGSRVVRVHSGMNDTERHRVWWQLRSGQVDIVLATRSGVFLEFKSLGLIVVDEEHDGSFKQQEGLRYHARSVAIKRAQLENIPVVLGSATPALETFNQVLGGRYTGVRLKQRIGSSVLPEVEIVDLNQHRPESGLSSVAIRAMAATLKRGEQVLVYINRRGYAPVLYCSACQWTAECRRCDARMTVHARQRALHCHHCGASRALPKSCDSCGGGDLIELGQGTQKIEETLAAQFPTATIQRFDRDNLSTANKLAQAMNRVHSGEIDILVGTQLLSKGHDFSGVSLVLVVNADQGLHSIDFRAPELLVQQLIQVAGRAGRGAQKGRVLIQSYFPDHPYLAAVQQHNYRQFVEQELQQRQAAGFPPYTHMALWRARSAQAEAVMQFLQSVATSGRQIQVPGTLCFDPVESPMFKRGGQYHAQLLVSAARRSDLHRWLALWIEIVVQERGFPRLKWSIDIDPISMF